MKKENKDVDADELGKIVGQKENSEFLRRDVAVIKDKKQYSLRIPSKFAELAKIKPEEDMFEFTLVPGNDKTFTIKAELKKGKK